MGQGWLEHFPQGLAVQALMPNALVMFCFIPIHGAREADILFTERSRGRGILMKIQSEREEGQREKREGEREGIEGEKTGGERGGSETDCRKRVNGITASLLPWQSGCGVAADTWHCSGMAGGKV